VHPTDKPGLATAKITCHFYDTTTCQMLNIMLLAATLLLSAAYQQPL
jgi:hypothetical protein